MKSPRHKITKRHHFSIKALAPFMLIFVGLGYYPVVKSFAVTPTCLNSGASISSALSSAVAGSTICLNAGSYSGWSSTISKSSMTTITAAPGVAASQITLGNVSFGSSQNITIDSVTIGGMDTSGSSAAHHIHVINSIFTGPVSIVTPDSSNMDILIDHNTFTSVSSGCNEGRISICGNNVNHTASNGVVISNNDLSGEQGGSNCSDGIQINGGANGAKILSNVLHNMKEGNCTQHADPIQFYGGENTLIDGNYFYGNSTGIMSGDGNGSPMTVTNNVFVTDGEYAQQVVIGGGSGDVISHNTFANGASIRIGKVNVGASSSETVKDNVLTGGFWFSENQSSTGFTIDYNLIPGGGGGTHGTNGSPNYTGGNNSTTYEGYALTATSPGHLAASDNTDIGITISGGTGESTYHIADLNNLKAHYGRTTGMTITDGDLNGDGAVNVFDLGILLSSYGA